jgi:oligoribonuclease
VAAVTGRSDSGGGEHLLVWLDLEMTGLDVETDAIVEIAAVVTDADLAVLDGGIDVVVHQPGDVVARMNDFVRAMHEKSGLLSEISSSRVDLETAGSRVLDYVRSHVPQPGVAPLCGNSIGMDRRFLVRYLPELDAHLHYRSIDVSSLKELCRRWFPDDYRKRPSKAEQHRALGDVLESIAELRYYRDAILKPRADGATRGGSLAAPRGAPGPSAPAPSGP